VLQVYNYKTTKLITTTAQQQQQQPTTAAAITHLHHTLTPNCFMGYGISPVPAPAV
jgi:hypothetical protein